MRQSNEGGIDRKGGANTAFSQAQDLNKARNERSQLKSGAVYRRAYVSQVAAEMDDTYSRSLRGKHAL